MNILIIEDELLIQKSLTTLLKKRGHHVDATALGKEAIELIKSNTYDRVICDLMLQDISGFDVIEESRSILGEDKVGQVFVIITAYSSDQVLTKANSYNCLLINKPFLDINSALDQFEKMSKAK